MREKFGIAISIIIALSLLYFIAPVNDLMTLFGRPQNVGEINGKGVSYVDFQEQVDKYTTINEIITGSSVQNEQAQAQIRDAAWQEFIDNYMFIKNAKAAGIKVGNQELVNLTSGSNPAPMIAQNNVFANEKGEYDPAMVSNFVQQMKDDETGRLRTYWNYLQSSVYNQQFYSKYGALFAASTMDNKLQLDEAVAETNRSANVDYVVYGYPFAKDTAITVSSKEINDYYNAHKDFFKQDASRDVEYVVFEVVPSAKDIDAASEEMTAAYDEFLTTDNMKAFLLRNSDRSFNNYWYKAGELSTINAELNDAVFGGAAVTPIIKEGNTFYAARVLENAMVPDSAFVKHILFQGANAKQRADSVLALAQAKGADFSALAAQYSADQTSNANGEFGGIGWMTQTYMLPGFESVLTAQVGKPYTCNTQYGSHVVLVSKKTAPIAKKQVAILEKTALPSKETYNEFYGQANKFASIAAGTYEGYKKALDSTKVYSHTQNNVAEGTSAYGAVDQAREVTRWIFDQKKAGKASNILTVNNNYFFVVALKNIHEEGYTPVSEASASIQNRLYSEKMHAKAKADVAAKLEGKTGLEAIAETLGTEVQSKTGLSFANATGAVEPALLGAIAAAPEGQVCGPVAGQMGVYYFKVTGREDASFFTEADAKNIAAQKARYASQMVLPVMMDAAEVKDHRARFF